MCSTFGSSGDVFPMLGLAVELARRGHEVTFATNEHYGTMTRECGLAFESLGTEEEFETSIKDPDLWKPVKAFARFISRAAQGVRFVWNEGGKVVEEFVGQNRSCRRQISTSMKPCAASLPSRSVRSGCGWPNDFFSNSENFGTPLVAMPAFWKAWA
jgi:hypothetical protein